MANPLLPLWRPCGRCLLEEAPPRVASRSALPHPGLLLCGASRRFSLAFFAFFTQSSHKR